MTDVKLTDVNLNLEARTIVVRYTPQFFAKTPHTAVYLDEFPDDVNTKDISAWLDTYFMPNELVTLEYLDMTEIISMPALVPRIQDVVLDVARKYEKAGLGVVEPVVKTVKGYQYQRDGVDRKDGGENTWEYHALICVQVASLSSERTCVLEVRWPTFHLYRHFVSAEGEPVFSKEPLDAFDRFVTDRFVTDREVPVVNAFPELW